jgi:hypothetical protein
MTPTIGRIVHYTFPRNSPRADQGNSVPGDVVPAIIVKVWSDTCVNLRIFQDGQHAPIHETSVCLKDEGNIEYGNHWDWPQRE